MPSRATLFTGHDPSLHGVTKTDGLAKPHNDPAMRWLDPTGVPTMGDWFRAGAYHTHYRRKWHTSYADLPTPGSLEGLKASDDSGAVIPAGVEAYQKADQLDPFGFSGWIGREPHGAAKADSGSVRDSVYANQVADLFAELSQAGCDQPWLAVASLVNPLPRTTPSLVARPARSSSRRPGRKWCRLNRPMTPTAASINTSTKWWVRPSPSSSMPWRRSTRPSVFPCW